MENKQHQDHDFSLEAISKESKKGFLPMLGFTFFSASMLGEER